MSSNVPHDAPPSRHRLSSQFRIEAAGTKTLPIRLRRADPAVDAGDFAVARALRASGCDSLVETLAQVRRTPSSVGITVVHRDGTEAFRSYADIAQRAKEVAHALHARHEIEPGDRVLVVVPTSFAFVETFLGVLAAGAIAVPLYPPTMSHRPDTYVERLRAVGASAGAKAAIAPAKALLLLGELALGRRPIRRLIDSDDLGRGASRHTALPHVAPDRVAFLQYTSGSTGTPKGVTLTHANLVANMRAIAQAGAFTDADVVGTWLPMYHDMGLVGTLLFAMHQGFPLVMLEPFTFLTQPSSWLKAITRHRVTACPAPNFGYARCVKRVRADEMKGLDLSSWRCAMSGAEAVSVRTLLDFGATFKKVGFREDAFLPVYGLAEATLAATFATPGEPVVVDEIDRAALGEGRAVQTRKDGFRVIGVGRAVPGHEVRVAGADGAPLGARRVGEIELRGPSCMSGYYGDDARAATAISGGWLRTGDLGYVADGQLFIVGRSKDVIKLRGRAYYADDFESAAETVKDVRAGCTVAFGVYDEVAAEERVIILCETRAPLATEAAKRDLLEEVRAHVGGVTGVTPDEVVLLRPGTIPKTSSGKRQRPKARELYLAGELKLTRARRWWLAWTMTKGSVGVLVSRARDAMSLLGSAGSVGRGKTKRTKPSSR